MSALSDLFTSLANKIRSKTGGSDTYTPTQMVSAIDDVYDAGIADATAPITPSNASPAGMTANVGYKPTANGYAISSYNNVTPSNSSPVALTSGDIDKMGGNGYAISSYSEISPDDTNPMQLVLGSIYKIRGYNGYAIKSNPTYVSPSNSSPAALTYGKIYRINATDGYAIKSYTPVTPSSTPISVASGTIVKMEDSGKIVDAISDKTPNDTTPPSVTSGEIVKMGGAGYLYATQQTGYDYKTTKTVSFSSKTGTLTGLTSGKKYYLIISFGWSNGNYKAELASATNTSGLTKVASGVDAVGTTYCNTNWSVYTFTATGTSSTLTFSSMSNSTSAVRVFLFEK